MSLNAQKTREFSPNVLRRIKLRTRLFVTFLIISLVPVITIGIFSYHAYTQSMNEKVKQAALQSIDLLNNNMSTQLGIYSDYMGSISVSDTVQNGVAWPTLRRSSRAALGIRKPARNCNKEVNAFGHFRWHCGLAGNAGDEFSGFGIHISTWRAGLQYGYVQAVLSCRIVHVRDFYLDSHWAGAAKPCVAALPLLWRRV